MLHGYARALRMHSQTRADSFRTAFACVFNPRLRACERGWRARANRVCVRVRTAFACACEPRSRANA
eukprot:8747487-Lingulodinium_polyedra.AAC.1